jgi:hypothetical protein
MNAGVGRLVTHFSYTPAFIIMAFAHPVAIFLIWRLRRMAPASA